MKTLFERLTDEARKDLESIKNEFPETYTNICNELTDKYSYLDLKYLTIVSLVNFGIAKGHQMICIDEIFNK
jgi:hypothetical protein